MHKYQLRIDKGLNIRAETVKLLEENTGRKLQDVKLARLYDYHIKTQTNGCELVVCTSSAVWMPSILAAFAEGTVLPTVLQKHLRHMSGVLCVWACVVPLVSFCVLELILPWLMMISWYSQCLVENCVLSKRMFSLGFFYDNIILSLWIFTQNTGRHLIRIP